MKDLTGRQFGRLTVLRPTEERKNGSVVWECRCSCGNIVLANGGSLASERIASCGCLRQERAKGFGAAKEKDITGQQFGRLTAIRATEERKNGSIVWECRCSCGKTVYASVMVLARKRSCGCLQRDAIQNTGRQRNKDISDRKFGLLRTIRPTDMRKDGLVVWECRCDCGCTAFVPTSRLLNGDTKSCGCLKYKKRRNDLVYNGGVE